MKYNVVNVLLLTPESRFGLKFEILEMGNLFHTAGILIARKFRYLKLIFRWLNPEVLAALVSKKCLVNYAESFKPASSEVHTANVKFKLSCPTTGFVD